MKESLELTITLSTTPSDVYNAFLNSEKHSEMTGGEAIFNNEIGGKFTAWDGYISGENKSLIENEEIIQSWRTTDFDESDEDSELILRFKESNSGCELTLIHANIPEGETQYNQGWEDHYFTPMKEYFNK